MMYLLMPDRFAPMEKNVWHNDSEINYKKYNRELPEHGGDEGIIKT
jgi:hypothetical protein